MLRILFLLLLILPATVFSQDAALLFKEGVQCEAGFKENEAFLKFAAVLLIQPANIEALCRCSDLCSRIGNRETDKSKKKDYFNAAQKYAEAALKINPDYGEANFVMSAAMGCMTMIKSGREKVMAVKEIRRYADKAIGADPSNYKAYYVLGRWNYEVSSLGTMEKTFVKWFFGGMPDASLQEAVNCFNRCRKLNPAFIMNYMELAKAYLKMDRKDKAIECLNTMIALPDRMLDDISSKITAKKMLQQLSER